MQLKSEFEDDSYPPTVTSVFGSEEPTRKSEYFHRWLRPREMKVEEDKNLPWSVFNDPHPTDILQGKPYRGNQRLGAKE